MYGSGAPRWRGYAFWLALGVVGLVLLAIGEGILTNLLTIAGIVLVIAAVIAVVGVWRGRPLIPRF
jgi:hypothetical protein